MTQNFLTSTGHIIKSAHRRASIGAVNPRSGASAISAARARLTAAAEKRETTAGYYGSGRLPEEIICSSSTKQRFDCVVTRNHYGCLVLNAAHTLFIDVDVLSSPGSDRLMPKGRSRKAPWQRVLDDLRVVLANERREGFRIYRTAAGYRILATTHEFEPGSEQANRLMNAVGADAAFVDLCRIQNSFRARLTPKPWRCRITRPPNAFPRHSTEESRRFEDWLARYERACRHRATCLYVGHVGPADVHKRIAPIIEFHDRETKALESLQLA